MSDRIDDILHEQMDDETRRFETLTSWIEEQEALVLPFLPLRGISAFPAVYLTFDVGRQGSLEAVRTAMSAERRLIFLGTQKDPMNPWPDTEELYETGTIAVITEMVDQPSGEGAKVTVRGLLRARIDACVYTSEVPYAEVLPLPRDEVNDVLADALEAKKRELIRVFRSYAVMTGRISPEAATTLQEMDDPSDMTDIMASQLRLGYEKRQGFLEMVDVLDRMAALVDHLHREIRLHHYEEELETKVRARIDEGQKEYYLREQLKVIQEELGDEDGIGSAVERYKEQLEELDMPDEHKAKLEKEIEKLPTYPASFPEAATLRNYLDTVFDLPWGRMSEENLSIDEARRQLDKDHYGLKDVKTRILEFLAVRRLAILRERPEYRSPIICLVGPPGVGKTSVAQSVATAMGRRYVRMSLGGVRDEAEIRGHRRTYIGALPGRIIQAIRQAGTDNPLILLDEVDKLASDYRGDPSSALLEVLDPEQNHAFRDHYLELTYDLSHVLFITTANDSSMIPDALRDRMELIRLSGYTEPEKVEIAKRHLLPKTKATHALDERAFTLPKPSIEALIEGYTMEAGVRQLERELAKLCRKIALEQAEHPEAQEQGARPPVVKQSDLLRYLGKPKRYFDRQGKEDLLGVCTGLAWTSVGGDTLSIETTRMPGKGKVTLTGQLGDVMQESAHVALAYLRSRGDILHIPKERFEKCDLHIHVPEGATPKDGPSAGITLATALASVLTGRKVYADLAMTGELTLQGRILPIGGVKEKLIAAERAGVKRVLLPEENMRDLDELPDSVKEHLTIIPVKKAMDVLKIALLPAEETEAPAHMESAKRTTAPEDAEDGETAEPAKATDPSRHDTPTETTEEGA